MYDRGGVKQNLKDYILAVKKQTNKKFQSEGTNGQNQPKEKLFWILVLLD